MLRQAAGRLLFGVRGAKGEVMAARKDLPPSRCAFCASAQPATLRVDIWVASEPGAEFADASAFRLFCDARCAFLFGYFKGREAEQQLRRRRSGT